MGKIIAIGGGFNDRDAVALARRVMELSGKARPNYLLVPTTAYDIPDSRSLALYSKMGCSVDVLYLTHAYMTEAIMAEKIRRADLINVPGGNLAFVMDVWRRTHADEYLREAYDQGKVLFGGSSGSMCWFREGFDDCGPEDSFMFVEGLGLLPYCNCPHYETDFWKAFDDQVSTRGVSAIACENETAICYIDGKWSVMVASARRDARAWFFDADDGFRRYDLTQHPEILERL